MHINTRCHSQEEGRVLRQISEQLSTEYSAPGTAPGSGDRVGPQENFRWGGGGNQYKMLQVTGQK